MKYLNNKVNYCIDENEDYETGCEIMTSYEVEETTEYICTKCKPGYLPYFLDNTTQVLYGDTTDKKLDFMDDLY